MIAGLPTSQKLKKQKPGCKRLPNRGFFFSDFFQIGENFIYLKFLSLLVSNIYVSPDSVLNGAGSQKYIRKLDFFNRLNPLMADRHFGYITKLKNC
jgi:hypothetical protein